MADGSLQVNIRAFDTGATRSSAADKFEYARFLDPAAIRRFAAYMHKHRLQADGKLRDPDNWKKGMPRRVYMDSLLRHVMDLWELHEYGRATDHVTGQPIDLAETLCAVLFNAMGYLREVLLGRQL